jgi:hypothetical protein
MADIVSKASSLDRIWIHPTQRPTKLCLLFVKPLCKSPSDLCDLEAVCEASMQEIASRARCHLSDA